MFCDVEEYLFQARTIFTQFGARRGVKNDYYSAVIINIQMAMQSINQLLINKLKYGTFDECKLLYFEGARIPKNNAKDVLVPVFIHNPKRFNLMILKYIECFGPDEIKILKDGVSDAKLLGKVNSLNARLETVSKFIDQKQRVSEICYGVKSKNCIFFEDGGYIHQHTERNLMIKHAIKNNVLPIVTRFISKYISEMYSIAKKYGAELNSDNTEFQYLIDNIEHSVESYISDCIIYEDTDEEIIEDGTFYLNNRFGIMLNKVYVNCNITGSSVGCTLKNITFISCTFTDIEADFFGCDCEGIVLINCVLESKYLELKCTSELAIELLKLSGLKKFTWY